VERAIGKNPEKKIIPKNVLNKNLQKKIPTFLFQKKVHLTDLPNEFKNLTQLEKKATLGSSVQKNVLWFKTVTFHFCVSLNFLCPQDTLMNFN